MYGIILVAVSGGVKINGNFQIAKSMSLAKFSIET